MPLPGSSEADKPWPPEEHTHLYDRYREHAAWYSGDPNMLADVYAYGYGQQHRQGEPVGAGAGGSMLLPTHNSLWRLNFDRFWARTTTAPWRRLMLHIPIAADIATTSADLLFADVLQVLIQEAHQPNATADAKAVQDRVEQLFELDGIPATLTEAAEAGAALGGCYLRATWDKDIEPEHPILTSVDADSAVPEFQWGRLTAVTFWRVVNVDGDKNHIWRHLERHEPEHVLHGLYKGTSSNLGTQMPLALMGPDWTVEDQMSDVEDVETGVPWLTAVYVPNMRPNRVWRGSQMGRSDYDGVEAIMDSLDETWTSWMRDLRLGRARLIIPQEYMDSQGPGKSGVFDLDQEVFDALPMAVARDENTITPSQFAIRAAEHMSTAAALLDRIVAAAGYSATTFGLEEVQRGVTATEIISRERRTLVTRSKKISYWKKPLADILRVYLALDAEHFAGPGTFRPEIRWPSAVQEDPGKMSATVVTLRQAMAASTQTLVAMVHPDWTVEEIKQEVDRINADQQALHVSPGGPVGAASNGKSGPVTYSSGAGVRGTGDNPVFTQFRGGHETMPPGSTQGGGE